MGALAALVVAVGTAAPGPGLDPDSQSYVGAAVTFARNGHFRVPTSSWTVADTTEPLTHFPPGFSMLMAAPIALGVTPLQAGRLVVVVAAAVTWAALVLLVATRTGLRTGLAVAAAALSTPALITAHLSILSEPAFFAALVVVLIGMMAMTERPTDTAAFWTGVAIAAAVMLRYAGVALAIAAVLWALRGPRRARPTVGERLRHVVLLAAPTVITLVPWLLRSVRLNGVTGVRTLGTYGGWSETLAEGAETIMSWVVPIGSGWWRGIAVVLAGIGVAVVLTRAVGGLSGMRRAWARVPDDGDRAAALLRARVLLAVVATVAASYLGFVLIARLVADPNIPFDERILAPLLLLVEIGLGSALWVWWPRSDRRSRIVVATALAAWGAASAGVTAQRIVFAREDGNDFASSDWRDSPTVAWVRSPLGGRERALYTNWPAALYFQASRASHDLPASLDGMTLHRFRDRLAHTDGVVVAFAAPSPDVAPPDSLARVMGLREVARFADGTIWELPGGTAAP